MMDLHPDDELLSALLDGEDDTTAAHVAGCDSCQARVEVLRAVAEVVADPFEPGAELGREHRIATAIAAMRRGRLAPEGPFRRTPADEDDTRAAVAKRVPWVRRGLPLLAAAAGLVIVVGTVARYTGEGETVGSRVGVGRGAERAGRADGSVAPMKPESHSLGIHPDAASLNEAVRAQRAFAEDSASGVAATDTEGAATSGTDCSATASRRAGRDVRFAGTALLAGQPVEVYRFGPADNVVWSAFSFPPRCAFVASG